ncbi:MAG: flavodoxin domain-containing protein, partial [Pseudomonadota bacterium]
ESLSIKPDGFTMKVKLRKDATRSRLVPGGVGAEEEAGGLAEAAARPTHGTPALVLYGSNLGSTEEFAREIARSAELNGFETVLAPLDDFVGKLPRQGAVLIASASYNGKPPDNAVKFVDWLAEAEPGAAEGVRYAVLGCGHSDWAATFQSVPREIDDALERLGGVRLRDRAETDARDDIDDQFHSWLDGLWPEVGEGLGLSVDLSEGAVAAPRYKVEFLPEARGNALIAQTGSRPVEVLTNRELQNVEASGRSTRHIEVALGEGMDYRTGDHLCVVPQNAPELVARVEARFGLSERTQIKLSTAAGGHDQLPTDAPISTRRLLTELVELQSVATRKEVEALARHTECPATKPKLEALAKDDYRAEVFLKRVSVLELLERHPACELPLGVFLEMTPPMAQRYYSISSSAKADPSRCSITVGVVDEPAMSGEGRFRGVCSTFLAGKPEGEEIFASLRETKDGFRLPEDAKTPLIMVGPGTGIAPFRGFLEERALLKKEGADLGPAMLFFGCRHPDQDYLYREELERHAADGVVELHTAFSRLEKTKTYVQDLLRAERERVWSLIEKGARIYVCGDGGRMEPDVRRALTLIYSEEKDVSAEAAEAWLDGMIGEGRYNLDVWVSN